MNISEAIQKAEGYIAPNGDGFAIDTEHIIECEYGYCFVWNTRKYLETERIEDMAIGPAAFIVPKNGDTIHCRGSSCNCEELIEEYIQLYEENNEVYSLWHEGELKGISCVRMKYGFSTSDLSSVINPDFLV